ncbi:DUF742 domain-containing protein [Fodinicola feengrottensis]|uniref:DUF742 domain-containing protein n=1 Tax=Fodinicola feengrottensis TaxID=435914 RepID=UPI0024420D67|nr:DUF742 domain-containing protein [Fodinicola feengrottensis]
MSRRSGLAGTSPATPASSPHCPLRPRTWPSRRRSWCRLPTSGRSAAGSCRSSPEAGHVAAHAEATFGDVVNAFSLGSRRRQRRQRAQEPPPIVAVRAEVAGQDLFQSPPPAPPEDVEAPAQAITVDTAATVVRPYTWTSGRTKSSIDLEIETLVSTTEQATETAAPRVEHRSIVRLCAQPRSVAEVASALSVPLGVAKVLLGDLADAGLIAVHRNAPANDRDAHLALMERVLSGLRRI